jgi:hypothetical protein
MEPARPAYLKRAIVALIISTLIFIGGFILGNTISYSKYESISSAQENIRYNLLSLQIERELLTSSCNGYDANSISSQLDNMGGIIGTLEQRLGKTNTDVLEQKKIYTVLEVEHFLLIKDYNKKCIKSVQTILFFYSNKKEFSDQAEKTGYILTNLKTKKYNIMIYSFDYDLDSPLIKQMKKNYNVSEPNTIIVNEKNKTIEINKIDDVEKLLR